MKNTWKPLVAVLVIAMTLPLLSIVADGSSVRVVVPPLTYRPGDPVNATVMLTSSTWVKGFETKVLFTKASLGAMKVTEGTMFKPQSTFFNAGVKDNTTGSVRNVYDLILGVGNATGDKSLVYLLFTAKAYGHASINLSGFGIVNESKYLSVSITNVSFLIVSPFDMDGDGTVGVLDLLDVYSHYGETGAAGWVKEDTFRDGKINLLDLIVVAVHWGAY